jgi:phosphatidate cytidylyltransferase
MLSRRLITALVLIPPLIAALFYLPTLWLAGLFGAFILVGAHEWGALAGLQSAPARVLYALSLTAFGALAVYALLREPPALARLLAVAVLWWLWALVELWRHPAPGAGWLATRVGRWVSGFCVLVPAWIGVLYLHATDPRAPALLLYLFVLVWTADTAAYFFGWLWGKHRLAPLISPGKTVEGALGALAAVVLLAYVCGTMFWQLEGMTLMRWLVVAVGTGAISIVGDLIESKLKRTAGVKDSGTLLPGHGGVLDRIDALTAAAPVFAAGWVFLLNSGVS